MICASVPLRDVFENIHATLCNDNDELQQSQFEYVLSQSDIEVASRAEDSLAYDDIEMVSLYEYSVSLDNLEDGELEGPWFRPSCLLRAA